MLLVVQKLHTSPLIIVPWVVFRWRLINSISMQIVFLPKINCFIFAYRYLTEFESWKLADLKMFKCLNNALWVNIQCAIWIWTVRYMRAICELSVWDLLKEWCSFGCVEPKVCLHASDWIPLAVTDLQELIFHYKGFPSRLIKIQKKWINPIKEFLLNFNPPRNQCATAERSAMTVRSITCGCCQGTRGCTSTP